MDEVINKIIEKLKNNKIAILKSSAFDDNALIISEFLEPGYFKNILSVELEPLFKTTEFHQTDDDLYWNVWECQNCSEKWIYDDPPSEDKNLNYCKNCGAKILKFVPLKNEAD